MILFNAIPYCTIKGGTPLINILINCAVDATKLLLELYNKGKIPYETFEANTQLKVKFIQYNVHKIQSLNERNAANKILNDCFEIVKHHAHFCNTQV